MFIQLFIECGLCFSYILYLAFSAFHEVDDAAASTVGFMIDLVFTFGYVAGKCFGFFYLFTAQVSSRVKARGAFTLDEFVGVAMGFVIDDGCLSN